MYHEANPHSEVVQQKLALMLPIALTCSTEQIENIVYNYTRHQAKKRAPKQTAFSRFEAAFNRHFGWFFTNGRKASYSNKHLTY